MKDIKAALLGVIPHISLCDYLMVSCLTGLPEDGDFISLSSTLQSVCQAHGWAVRIMAININLMSEWTVLEANKFIGSHSWGFSNVFGSPSWQMIIWPFFCCVGLGVAMWVWMTCVSSGWNVRLWITVCSFSTPVSSVRVHITKAEQSPLLNSPWIWNTSEKEPFVVFKPLRFGACSH